MIEKIQLGSTDIFVSRVGLGTAKWGRNEKMHYPHPFELPTDDALIQLLHTATDCGINLLDTAPAYGHSEERIGKLFKQGRFSRPDWIFSTKVGEIFINSESHFDFSEKSVRISIENSLQKLQTDYLDVVLIHSNGEDKKIIEETDVFKTLLALKKSGVIRAIGISTKTIEGGLLAIPLSDVLMVTYNPTHTDEKPVIVKARNEQKGIFIKKALASGHLEKIASDDPIQIAMNCVFELPISSVIVGTLNPSHLIHNVDCAERVL